MFNARPCRQSPYGTRSALEACGVQQAAASRTAPDVIGQAASPLKRGVEPVSTPAVLPRIEELHEEALRLFREGKYEKSAEVLSGVLKNEESGELWNDWATAQLMCSRAPESERGYRRALELEPRSYRAAGNLGIVLASVGRVTEALPFLEQAASGSSDVERRQLLQVLGACRERANALRTNAPDASAPKLLEQMARVIHLQSQSIARLERRLSVLEAGAGPAVAQPASAAALSPASAGQSASVRRPAPAPQPGIFFRALIYGGSGYSEENWVEAEGLADHGLPVHLEPIGEASDEGGLIPTASRQKLSALQRQLVDLPSSVIYQAAPVGMWELDLSGRRRIGRTMFETDRIPYNFVEPCNTMDEVWVPTRFNMETFAAAGVDSSKLRLVPPGVDASLFRPRAEPLPIAKKRGFSFLSIFDWQQRKGYDVLLKAYLGEFKADEDVSLVLKVTQQNDMASSLEAELRFFIERVASVRLEDAPPIILLRASIPQADMPRLYAASDCFVLPSRGEGYGRPYLEALACELPVIATGWSGQTDFLSQENSYPIENRVTPVPGSVDLELFVGHRWAEPDIEHLGELMRRVYSHRDEAHRKAERGRQDILQRHDWKVIIPLWVKEFQRLLS